MKINLADIDKKTINENEAIEKYFKSEFRYKKLSLPLFRCQCKNKKAKKKTKKTFRKRSEGRPVFYPLDKIRYSKTFQINYQNHLTIETKFLLNSFRNKYLYYAIDDINDILNFNPKEKSTLLMFLYSSMIFLHHNFYVNLFDIWIEEIYLKEKIKNNRFIKKENKRFVKKTEITLKLFYTIRLPMKKPDPLW